MSLLERWFIALQEPPKTKRAEEFYYEQEIYKHIITIFKKSWNESN